MIRMITEADIPIILNWYNWYIENDTATFETEPLTLSEFAQRVHTIREKYPWVILEEEGKPAGYAYLASFIPRAAYDWTCDLAIYLDPEQRGKGYGTKLIQGILDIARQAGYVTIVSNITFGNTASERLHEANGFIRKGILEDVGYKFGRWLSISWYEKKLNPAEGKPEPVTNPENTERGSAL